MRASAAPRSTPEGPGSVSGAPNLPAGFTDTFTSRYIDTGALRLHAVIGGEGPPLLLVHGWPETWYADRGLRVRAKVRREDDRAAASAPLGNQGESKPVRARERRVVSAFSNGGPTPEGQGAESPRGVHRHRRRSVNELDRGHHFAAWQEPDLFTTEIRAAFRSLREGGVMSTTTEIRSFQIEIP